MKILYLVHQFYPERHAGTEKFLLNLSTTMQKWGHKVKVISYGLGEDDHHDPLRDKITLNKYVYKGIEVVSVQEATPPYDVHAGIGNATLAKLAEMMLREESPDIFHVAHSMRLSEFALAAARLALPYLVTMTDFFLMCPKCTLITDQRMLCWGPESGAACTKYCPAFQPDMIQRRLALGGQVLRDASGVVAPSRFLGMLFQREFPFLSPKVIPYGIDFSRIAVNRRKYTGTEEFVVLFAGQLDYHKGVHVLIDAVKRVKDDRLRLRLYGSGPDSAVRQFRDMAKGDGRITFCGVYEEDTIAEVFGSADIVAIPSNWHENNTIVMREAIASHVPCIVSNAGGMREKIQDGVNGFIFPMGDAAELQRILERLLSDPGQLAAVKSSMLKSPLLSVEQEAFAYEMEYKRIVASRASVP